MPVHHPHSQAQVLSERVEQCQSPLVAIVLLDLIHPAERAPGGGPRLLGRQARGYVLFREQLEMRANFLLEPAFAAAGDQRVDHPRHQHADTGHDASSSRRLTIETVRAQSSASLASWRRPDLVIE